VVGWNRYDKIDLQYQGQIVCTITGTKPIIVIKPDTLGVNDSLKVKESMAIRTENITAKKDSISKKKESIMPKKESIVIKKETLAPKKKA
jgi:hypothetical protein